MSNSVNNTEEKKCCGCGACSQICPKNAICLEENDRGFLIPSVDENKCVDCGLCKKVCPEIETPSFSKVINAYAAISNEFEVINRSTSGGIFGELANYIIGQGGVVYGCAWNNQLLVEHIRIEKNEDLKKIQQSKYVQSNTCNSYKQVANDLTLGKYVLYSGTGCQISGLRKYLKKEYDNLYTLEVACHGVPSSGLFKKYITFLEDKYNNKIIEFQFRNKEKHKKGEHFMFSFILENGKKIYKYSNEDSYYGSFLGGRTLRETCYHCKYKENERVSDIMLSDYWGIEKEHKGFPSQNGASAIIISSDKGEKLLNEIRDNITLQESSFEKIVKHNKSIISSAICSDNEKLISINVDSRELFDELTPPFNLKKRIQNCIPEKFKYYIKKII